MSDTTETETDTNTDNTDEPSKAELHDRVQQLESTVQQMMPSRRDALRMGAAGIAGAAGLSATTQTADASTGSAGQIGDSANRPTIFADDIDANSLTGSVKNQGCRVFMNNDQTISQGTPTKVDFDTESYDSDNNYNLTANEWTCPEDGLYAVTLQVQLTNGSSGDERAAVIGGPASAKVSDAGSEGRTTESATGVTVQTSTVNKYNSGDKIVGYVENRDSSDRIGRANNNQSPFMEVAFLGGL